MKRRAFFSACVTGLAAIVLALFLGTTADGSEPLATLNPSNPELQQEAPSILAIAPNEAPNNLDTTITVTGTGFQAVLNDTQVLTAPLVSLDGVSLAEVGWVSSHTLTATVPWGLDPGVYMVTVTNPDGQFGQFPDALTVTQAVGVWTTSGPYGGSVGNLAVSPLISGTAFAAVGDAGLFRTQDGGDQWHLALADRDARGIMYGVEPQPTSYYWGRAGLWRSVDEGLNFVSVLTGTVTAFIQHPDDPQIFWVGRGGGVKYTSNGGGDLEFRRDGLPHDYPVFLTIDPLRPSVLYAIMIDGQVFKTIDSGLHWASVSDGLPAAAPSPNFRLAVNPFAPDTLLYAYFLGPDTGYRSTDGGDSWSPVCVDGSPGSYLSDLAFSPYVSGTVYASDSRGQNIMAVSTDGGATWIPMVPRYDEGMRSLALDPATGVPVYLGGESTGVKRSLDGGLTWEMATEGITGLPVSDLEASPLLPQTVYVASGGAGAIKSDNAGRSWQKLALPSPFALAIALDSQASQTVYVSPGREVFRSRDGGSTWELGDRIADDTIFSAFSVAPSDPSILYLGGYDEAAVSVNRSIGLGYRSTDYGGSWTPLTFTVPISGMYDLAVNPTDAQIVYVATGSWTNDVTMHPGKGVFRSTDGGGTWQPMKTGMGDVSVYDLAIHPDQPQTIYATAWLSSEWKVAVFKTTDGAATWYPTEFRTGAGHKAPRGGPPLVIDPLVPDTVYVGTADGLYQSLDGGETWTTPAGVLGHVPILQLSAAASDHRTIVYAGTQGGELAGVSALSVGAAEASSDGFVQGGVYQYTVDHRSGSIYLPLVFRDG